MLKSGLFGTGALCLAAGIALWIYGYNLEPTIGEAISNAFDKDFTEKRNLLMYTGVGLSVVGVVSLVGGGIFSFRKR